MKGRSMIHAAAILGLLVPIWTAKVGAHEGRGGGVCKADVEKFCKGVEKGKGGIGRCLMSHQKELSSDCRNKLEEKRRGREACRADKQKFCATIQPGDGRIRECMKSHEKELSADCRSFIEKKRQHFKKTTTWDQLRSPVAFQEPASESI